MAIQLDPSERPLFVVRGSGELRMDDYLEYLKDCTEEFFRLRITYALVFDATGMETMPSQIRKKQAEWINEHRAHIKKYCVGTAFVLTSSFQRGMLTGIHWISPPPYPHLIVASFDEGYAWAKKQLQDAGVAIR